MRITLTKKSKFNTAISFIAFLLFQYLNAQITLNHNIGTTLVKTDMYTCQRDESWSKLFTLSDFGIKPNEQFLIKSGQVGISKSEEGSNLFFSVYSIDDNFPVFFHSTYPRTELGRRSLKPTTLINGAPQVLQFDFDEPIIVPAGTKRIMVTVHKQRDIYNPKSGEVYIAGTAQDNGESWYFGCDLNHGLSRTTDLTIPVPNANFYINVTGEVFDTKSLGPVTRLSHNLNDEIIDTGIHSCSSSYIYWARAFTLKDFGISNNEEFVINSGQVGINKTGWLAQVAFNIYEIDDSFPCSFSEKKLIGSSQYQELTPSISEYSQIVQVEFDRPIKIPAGVKKILVEVHKGIVYGEGVAFIAGTTQSEGESWQRGCTALPGYLGLGNGYVSTADFGKPQANFYINVTGNVNQVKNNIFEMNVSNICSEFLKEFSVNDQSNIASIAWNFGDPDSGATNISTDLSPFHDFSADGKYTVTAVITARDGSVETLTETIDVKEPPKAYGINNIYACENNLNTGFSTSFDTSTVTQQVLGGQTEKTVTFIDGKGNKYNALPNPFTNRVKDRETITVKVSHNDNPCCYSETTFDLIVNAWPNIPVIKDLNVCDNDADGFAEFDLLPVETSIVGATTNLKVEFYHQNGQKISSPINTVSNLISKEETLKIRVTNTNSNCFNESTFKIIVNPLPVANTLQELIGCDDNNDGISEYFDTSKVESAVLGNQQGMRISYFYSNGNSLISPLPNPYTNTSKNQEVITVRVTNILTNCYKETSLVLKTASQPIINKPSNKYACDEGNGFGTFDLSNLTSEIIGNQSGLKIMYFDVSGNLLPSPLPSLFRNSQSKSQTIKIRVENETNSLCNSETSFDLLVNELPTVNIEKTYFLCNLEASLHVNVAANLDSYNWKFNDGDIISNTNEADLTNAGKYTLVVGKIQNDMYCENKFEFELVRSILPTIKQIKYQELSDNNYIEIIPTTEGDLEYSIDGINYQDSNYFSNVQDGTYIVYIRDKEGCGSDSREVTVVDYPKFFTPNNDGNNDFWLIKSMGKFPNSKISIFDRYGKLIKELFANDSGWDGFYNGSQMPADDYWFKANFTENINFSGHFSLKK